MCDVRVKESVVHVIQETMNKYHRIDIIASYIIPLVPCRNYIVLTNSQKSNKPTICSSTSSRTHIRIHSPKQHRHSPLWHSSHSLSISTHFPSSISRSLSLPRITTRECSPWCRRKSCWQKRHGRARGKHAVRSQRLEHWCYYHSVAGDEG
jgi:hypothetical protein